MIARPATEAELVERAEALAGLSLGELAVRHGMVAPPDLRRAKGFSGQLLELALGATAASRAEPDFPHLGIELKSLPVDRHGRPCESTFVCTIELRQIGDLEWESSRVRKKLARVLWVPIQGQRDIPPGQRRIGTPLLWSPDDSDEAELRFDWEELAGLIGRGDVEAISGHMGRFLQVRPKAANSRARRPGVDANGARVASLPRGFYLRARFTERLLKKHYHLKGASVPSPVDRDD